MRVLRFLQSTFLGLITPRRTMRTLLDERNHRTMKRIVLALCITAVASFAIAQEPHAMKMRMGPDSGEVAATLGLSTDQKVQWDSIHQQLQASVEPLFQQLHAAHEQLEALASSLNPNPTGGGKPFLPPPPLAGKPGESHARDRASEAHRDPDARSEGEVQFAPSRDVTRPDGDAHAP